MQESNRSRTYSQLKTRHRPIFLLIKLCPQLNYILNEVAGHACHYNCIGSFRKFLSYKDTAISQHARHIDANKYHEAQPSECRGSASHQPPPNKHEALTQCWATVYDVGPALINTGPTPHGSWAVSSQPATSHHAYPENNRAFWCGRGHI